MKQVIPTGDPDFRSIREKSCFYVDKTSFIKEWWESEKKATLITRPRRFGKTLNLSMIESFFSNQYEGRSDLFEGLSIWEEEKYQKLQGTYPGIFLSFAEIKNNNFKDAREGIIDTILECYQNYIKLWEETASTTKEKNYLTSLSNHAKKFHFRETCSRYTCNKGIEKIMLLFKLLLQQKSNHSFR